MHGGGSFGRRGMAQKTAEPVSGGGSGASAAPSGGRSLVKVISIGAAAVVGCVAIFVALAVDPSGAGPSYYQATMNCGQSKPHTVLVRAESHKQGWKLAEQDNPGCETQSLYHVSAGDGSGICGKPGKGFAGIDWSRVCGAGIAGAAHGAARGVGTHR